MTRAELYTLVWQEPVSKLATRFGLSHAALRKVCTDFNIPVPPPGYWTRRAHGKEENPPPLPRLAPNSLGRLNAVVRKFGDLSLQLAEDQLNAFDVKLPTSPNAARQSERHPVAQQLQQALLQAVPDERGFVACADDALPM